MRTKQEIIIEIERLKKSASTCEDQEIRQNLITQINTLLWVHNDHYNV